MDNAPKKSEPKISLVEIIVFGIFIITADVAEFLATLSVPIPALGEILPVIALAYGFTVSAFTLFWLIMKGISTKWFLGGAGVDMIPVLNALPARSAAFIATVIEDRLPPETKKLVTVATKATGPIAK
jgi:predicted RND superfamily exporter protein